MLVVPEAPSQIADPLACIILIFVLDWRMGLASLITLPLSVPFIIGMMQGYGDKMATYLRAGNEMNAALVEYVGGSGNKGFRTNGRILRQIFKRSQFLS